MYYYYERSSRLWDIVITIGLTLLSAICLLAIVITLISPKGSDGASQMFGYELRIVTSDSMEASDETDVSGYDIGSFKKNTMVALDLVPDRDAEARDWYSNIEVGDVLTFRYAYDRQLTITHRVVSKTEKEDGSGFIFELAGDNKDSTSTPLYQTIDTSDAESHNYIIGKVIWKSRVAGVLVGGLQRFAKSFQGE